MIIVAPTRSGKGLLAVSQLLTWKQSVVVNDPKGELFHATGGFRATLGKVYVIDVTGAGHRFDPLQGKETQHELLSAATQLLHIPDEKDPIFTQTAIIMLTQIFLAARKAGHAPFPFTLHLISVGLPEAARIINTISPELCTAFLETTRDKADFTDKYLKSCYGTLATRMRQLLTEQLVKTLANSDFDPEELMLSEKPVTIYLKWKEEDLLALTPMIRLTWNSIMRRLITTYDTRKEKGKEQDCKPVLMLIDEGANPPIPALAQYAATVVGRNIYLQVYIQDLSQLDTAYGKEQATTIRGNMETWLFYRPNDLETAEYISRRIGNQSAYAHSFNKGETAHQERSSQGLAEQGIPLITPQDIMQLKDEEIICFHRRLPPFKISRMDWRHHPTLAQRRNIPAPQLPPLPQIADLPTEISQTFRFPHGYIDPDMVN